MSQHPRRDQQATSRLQHLLELDHQLVQWADDWAEGYGSVSPTGGHNTGRSKGEHGTPTEAKAMGRVQGAGLADQCERIHQCIHRIIADIAQLHREAQHLEPLAQTVATELAKAKEPRNWGAGMCSICDTYCPGVGEDRLRAGMCRTHYDAFRYACRCHRSNIPLDRHMWIQQMRQSIALTKGEHE